jgi:hypothetical protein
MEIAPKGLLLLQEMIKEAKATIRKIPLELFKLHPVVSFDS